MLYERLLVRQGEGKSKKEKKKKATWVSHVGKHPARFEVIVIDKTRAAQAQRALLSSNFSSSAAGDRETR
jgi:hypothetical protein